MDLRKISNRLRRRSKGPQSQIVASAQDDPLTSAYSQQSQDLLPSAGTGSLPITHSHSPSRSRIQAAAPDGPSHNQRQSPARGEILSGQAITINNNDDMSEDEQAPAHHAQSSVSLPEATSWSRRFTKCTNIYTYATQGVPSSSKFEEDVASRNAKLNQGVPPVPPIRHLATSGASTAG